MFSTLLARRNMTSMESSVLISHLIIVFRLRPLSYTDTDIFILLCARNQKDSLLNIRLVSQSSELTPGNILSFSL